MLCVSFYSMRSAFCSIVVLMVVSAILQLSLIIDFSASDRDVAEASYLTTELADPLNKAKSAAWESAPELNRASFSSHSDSDDCSLSSLDENTSAGGLSQKLKCE